MKKIITFFTFLCVLLHGPLSSFAEKQTQPSTDGWKLSGESALLMEASTQTILFEKNAHKKLRPASITKIMTLLLIFESLEQNKISKNDLVSVSAHAAGMGGSQVFLEENETQTVQDLIKCISIASANDACVAMAEYIAGSEDAFVGLMNEKARKLGMNDTTFVNSCGLEADGHVTSAYDIAIMARELSVKHPQIFDYCTIWMDSIIHRTKKGEKEFGLTNTNKLLRYYSYATGLKTGYTSLSKYCLAATASRDDLDLIAVVMAEPTPTQRTADVISLFNYGFANCKIYKDENADPLPALTIEKGTEPSVPIKAASSFRYVITSGKGKDSITKKISLPAQVTAPVKQGQTVGYVEYFEDQKKIGSVPIVAQNDVKKRTLSDTIQSMFANFFTITEKTVAKY